MTDMKPSNPKDSVATYKAPLHLVPSTLPLYASMAFAEGDAKYGGYNWRVAGVRASVYKSALERHLAKWWNGEWADKATGVPHLASVLACAGIILDAGVCGKLSDDRPPAAPVSDLAADIESVVRNLYEMHKDKKPNRPTLAETRS